MQSLPALWKPGICAHCGAPADANSTFIPRCAPCAARQPPPRRPSDDGTWLDEQRRIEAERRRRRIEAVLASIQPKYQGIRWGLADLPDRVRRHEAIAEAQEAIGRPMVLLTGGAGAGKTTLASAILHDVVERALAGDRAAADMAWSGLWVSAPTLARARREYALGKGEAPEVQRALGSSLLVIDDLGAERDDRDGALGEVIYERHAREAPTVVTTGETYRGLVKRYGDGIARRLTEQPGAVVVRCMSADTVSAVSGASRG